MRILVVDDEKTLVKGMKFNLENEGYEVECAYDGAAALELAREGRFDLILLDVMMPGLSGIELCREIRTKAMMPILFLSAKTRDVDKAEGLANGGDDYLIKPFSALELTSRVKALLRRSMVYQPQTAAAPPQTVQSGELSIDLTTGAAALAGNPLTLTETEAQLLRLLAQHRGDVLSAREIYEAVWKLATFPKIGCRGTGGVWRFGAVVCLAAMGNADSPASLLRPPGSRDRARAADRAGTARVCCRQPSAAG